MATPLLATKLYIPPPRAKIVLRPRLIERLNDGLQRAPGVTLISAPAGFRKTTLVSEWVGGCVDWLSGCRWMPAIAPPPAFWLTWSPRYRRWRDPQHQLTLLAERQQALSGRIGCPKRPATI